MNNSELYILMAVFGLLTIALVWFCAKFLLDMRKRNKNLKERRRSKRSNT